MSLPVVLASLVLLALPARADELGSAATGARELLDGSAAEHRIRGQPPASAAPGASLPFDPSVPQAVRAQLLADFGVLSSLQGGAATPLHRQVYGPLEGASYLRYFDSRVNMIGSDVCGPPAAVACVQPKKAQHTMWLAPTYSTFNLPQVYRLAVVLHEARHTESAHRFYDHVKCPAADLQGHRITGIISGSDLTGLPGCDKVALGAYGVSAVFFKNVSRYCSNCSGKLKQDADLYGDDTLHRIIDQSSYDALHADLY